MTYLLRRADGAEKGAQFQFQERSGGGWGAWGFMWVRRFLLSVCWVLGVGCRSLLLREVGVVVVVDVVIAVVVGVAVVIVIVVVVVAVVV